MGGRCKILKAYFPGAQILFGSTKYRKNKVFFLLWVRLWEVEFREAKKKARKPCLLG